MNKNMIFIAVTGGALVLAVLASLISGEEHDADHPDGDRHRLRINMGDQDGSHHRSRSQRNRQSSIEFNGKTYQCDEETGFIILEHEGGQKTKVICD